MKSICNVDWLELYCSQYNPKLVENKAFSATSGCDTFDAALRPYGTRVYRNVWKVSYNGHEFMEICCCPLSAKTDGGILKDTDCHVKLCNYWLYTDVWYQLLTHALGAYCIKPIKPARLDICCDFQYLRNGLSGAALMAGIVKRNYVKVHQPKWSMHGIDSDKKLWINSLSFGSKKSAVFTRFYNKSFELLSSGKTYIADMWLNVGFKEGESVYRVELSIAGTGLESIDKATGCILSIDWESLSSRQYIEEQFLYYSKYYFDIRRRDNARKDRCSPLDLFDHTDLDYKAWQNPRNGLSGRTTRLVINYLTANMQRFAADPDSYNALMKILYTEVMDTQLIPLFYETDKRNADRAFATIGS